MKKVPYKSAVGAEIYLAMTTRLDVATSTSMVAQFNSKPKHHHWSSMKMIFRYLRESTTNGLIYNGSDGNLEVIGYCNSDWGGNVKDIKSRIGYVYILANAVFFWNSKLQHVVALSIAKAEYYAAGAAAKETL
jgi:hypothetical protein